MPWVESEARRDDPDLEANGKIVSDCMREIEERVTHSKRRSDRDDHLSKDRLANVLPEKRSQHR